MELMAQYPDNHFDLAIVDPIYGIMESATRKDKSGLTKLAKTKEYPEDLWDQQKSPPEYFKELLRVSNNQIIFGGNYFTDNLFESRCWIVWDKDNKGTIFADAELAWTSFKTSVRIFKYRWNGMLQENMKDKEIRIHPTQKPVALYKWLLQNYAKQGDKILDTHVGSASSLIACLDLGFDVTGCELSKRYYDASMKRINEFLAQGKLF
jgi:site-specific DNA-methyltransferase (adenine-specific)